MIPPISFEISMTTLSTGTGNAGTIFISPHSEYKKSTQWKNFMYIAELRVIIYGFNNKIYLW